MKKTNVVYKCVGCVNLCGICNKLSSNIEKEVRNEIKMLKRMQKEIFRKTNMFTAEKSVVKMVFEKYIKAISDKEKRFESFSE